jgi:hypothetical protein
LVKNKAGHCSRRSALAFEAKTISSKSHRDTVTWLPKHAFQIAVATVLLGFILVNAIAPAAAQDGWVTLFDGKNLDQWDQVGGSNWHIAVKV